MEGRHRAALGSWEGEPTARGAQTPPLARVESLNKRE